MSDLPVFPLAIIVAPGAYDVNSTPYGQCPIRRVIYI